MVWDTIYGRPPHDQPVEEWGGIAYALAGLEAALPSDWEIVPLIKVGSDSIAKANQFLTKLTHRSAARKFIEVDATNPHVTIRYESETRKAIQISGGVPPWTWPELGPMVEDLDALYINFISGFELDLQTAQLLSHGFPGPIYADLHSLFLGVGKDGIRTPNAVSQPHLWVSCFDVVQLNQDEMTLLGDDPMAVAAGVLSAGVRLLIVTLGADGAVYFTSDAFDIFKTGPTNKTGTIQTARIGADLTAQPLDTTGCGDVFGGTLMAQLVQGIELQKALRTSNIYAARNVSVHGASNLHYHLRGEIAPL